MIEYVLTSHGHLEGVRLSRLGSWGNIPYDDDVSARAAADVDARGQKFTIRRRHFGRRR